jgi:hypothetical protein
MTVHIRSSTLVEAVVGDKVTAKAYKSDPMSGTWFLGKYIDERWFVVGTFSQPMTEADQRKAVIATLEIIE